MENHRSPTAPAGAAGSATRVLNSPCRKVHEANHKDVDEHAFGEAVRVDKLLRLKDVLLHVGATVHG